MGEFAAILFGVGWEGEYAVLIGADTGRFIKYFLDMHLLYWAINLRFDAGLHQLNFGLGNTKYKSFFEVEKTRPTIRYRTSWQDR